MLFFRSKSNFPNKSNQLEFKGQIKRIKNKNVLYLLKLRIIIDVNNKLNMNYKYAKR